MTASAPGALEARDAFFEQLRNARERALLLDYDGTLAPFQSNRLAAFPYAGIPELLQSISMEATHTRVALITGRRAMELRLLLPFTPAPEIWGSHGLERLKTDGSYELAKIAPDAAQVLAAIERLIQADGLETYAEKKPGTIAVHWRGLPESLARDIREQLLRIWNGLPPQPLVILSPFDGGMEFRLGSRNKGDAVREIVAELQDTTPVAYLGDDLTDEDAFKALRNRGLAVLVREQLRATAAELWIQPPQGVLSFLSEWLRACETDGVREG